MNTVNGWIFSGGFGALGTAETNTTLTVHLDERESNAKGASFDFNASRCANLFGNTNTNQPNSLRALVLIRSY